MYFIKLILLTIVLGALALFAIMVFLALFQFLMTVIVMTAVKIFEFVSSILFGVTRVHQKQYHYEDFEYAYDSSDFESNDEEAEPVQQKPALDPYTVLGIKRGATKEEIRSAYKNQMVMYHPDKAAHLGPKLRELALQQTKLIREAYDALM